MTDKRFLGRPQSSCYQCRERRVKCGKQRPGCLDCQEAGIKCHGYRPKVSLHFKDESQLAANKVQARKRKQAREYGISQSYAPSNPQHPVNTRVYLGANIDPHYLPTPVLDVALSGFINQYLGGSLLSGLRPLYSDTQPGSPLSISVYAPALAYLAIASGQHSVMTLARSQYARGIQRTNRALCDPQERVTDDTLASIMHLGLFEAVSFDAISVQANWTSHVLGALEILKLRGLEQLNTSIGRELYITVMLGITYSRVQRRAKLPQEVMDFDFEASKIIGKAHPTYRLHLLLNAFADIQFVRSTGTASPSEIVQQSLQLDEAIVSFFTEQMGPELDTANGGLDVLLIRKRNTLRTLRMVLNSWMQTYIGMDVLAGLRGDFDDQHVYSHAHEVMNTMAHEILEDTNQFLAPHVSLNGRFMIIHLTIIVEEPLMPQHLRNRAMDTIRYIGSRGRIPEALHAVKRLEHHIP